MNILFLSLTSYNSLNEHNIYTDLLREFTKNGHTVYGVCPTQKRFKQPTTLIKEDNASILRVLTGNLTKVGFIEKGISTLLICDQFISAIKKHFKGVKFDLILYPTPPITLEKVVRYFKNRDNAKTYLMLKDIFPQNAIDINIMSKHGIKGLIYRYFRLKERGLYKISDRIGCMSQANVDYVLKHNPEINPEKVEICPNSIEVSELKKISEEERISIREKYGIPLDKKVFVYGGNLGRPQGIPFIIQCLKTQENNPDAFFLIVGSGTEYAKLESYIKSANPENIKLMNRLPKEDYDLLVNSCDVGMIFLHHKFTIPNFPSRALGYMQSALPIFACTDPNTDIGKVIVDGGFGWWCESNDTKQFASVIKEIAGSDTEKMGIKGREYLLQNYTSENCYNIIMK